MKKLTAILVALLMLMLPLSGIADVSFPLSLSHEWASFDMGVTHSAAVHVGGFGYAWGYNYNAPIGNGVTASSDTFVPYNWGTGVTAVSANNKTTLSIDGNGVLSICGAFWWGIGGDSSMPSGGYIHTAPTQFATNVRSASMGFNHMVYVKNDNTLWVYGENAHGQLGDNSTTSYYTGAGKKILDNVSYAVAGDCLTAAVKTDGTLWVWGFNYYGQVGNGSSGANADRKSPVQVLTNVYSVSTMGDHVVALKNDGSVWAWGLNDVGQLGRGNTTNATSPVQVTTGAVQVSAGYNHTAVLKADGSLWFCGCNYRGAFGNGVNGGYSAANSTFRQTPGTWVAVNCGTHCTAAVAPTGQLFTTGHNDHGKLGLGSGAPVTVTEFTATDIWIFGEEGPATYTVRFVDWDGTLLSEQEVNEGEAASAPAAPTRIGYEFTGWDKDFSSVTEDMTVTATYTAIRYTLTINYVDENGVKLAPTFTRTYTYGESYSISSPIISGYTANTPLVSGVMGAANLVIDVVYTQDQSKLKGDVNCDGIVDSADITLAAAYSMTAGTVTAQGIINGDMNGDGLLTAADLSALYSYILG